MRKEARKHVDEWLRERKIDPATVDVDFVEATGWSERETVDGSVTYNQAKDGVRGPMTAYYWSSTVVMEWDVGYEMYEGTLTDGSGTKPTFKVVRLPYPDWEEDVIAIADAVAEEEEERAAAERREAEAKVRERVIAAVGEWLWSVGIDPASASIKVANLVCSDKVVPSGNDPRRHSGSAEATVSVHGRQFELDVAVATYQAPKLKVRILIAPELSAGWRPAQDVPQIAAALKEERELRAGHAEFLDAHAALLAITETDVDNA